MTPKLQFIPLKSKQGELIGHARVRGNALTVQPKGTERGAVPILTDRGEFRGTLCTSVRFDGTLEAVLLHENGTVHATGFAKGCLLTRQETERRLMRATEQHTPARTPEPADKPKVADRPAPDIRIPEPNRVEPIPSAPTGAQKRFLFPESAPDTIRHTESFAALLRRTERVFSRMTDNPVQPVREPVLEPVREPVIQNTIQEPVQKPVREPVREPVPEAEKLTEGPRPDWASDVNTLLLQSRQSVRTVGNPFPHIFPGATFTRDPSAREDTLTGRWLSGGERLRITAVRGAYSPRPPERLNGFTRYIRARSGGYWVRVAPEE